ncbi:hypothetical protein Q5O24_15440 [Eubacteriaceae bacterium ES3]|nr:hypothetical protein Q5O24_15440 [Eubacteriaceae bacterium ES3]
MAVKARETLESKQLSLPAMAVVLILVVGYTVGYNRLISYVTDEQLKMIIGVISLAVMMTAFIISLRFITTSFEMLLTHNRLIIERKIFFWKKIVAEIDLATVTDIEAGDRSKKVEGSVKNFTLINIPGKRKYVVYYKEKGKNCSAKVQCSSNFYELLKKQVKI